MQDKHSYAGGQDYKTTTLIRRLEDNLVRLGLKRHNIAAVLCKRAKLDRTTWQRWRLGDTEPTLANWRRTLRHVEKLMEDLSNGKTVVARRRRKRTRKARR